MSNIKSSENTHISQEEQTKAAQRVSVVSIVGNVVLSAFKILTGLFGKSGAMVSDGIHSLSDVFSSIVVIIGIRIAAKEPDKDHPYGHERFECVAAIILAVLLLVTGLFISHGAIGSLTGGADKIAVPSLLAAVAAIVSIFVKEAMYFYTRHYAVLFDSGALMADAWHHRSDSLSSVGALVGIIGARLGYTFLEPVASLVICVFIVKAAYDIFRDAVSKLVDKSCNEETEALMRECAARTEGVDSVKSLHTRVFGNRIYVEAEIEVDGRVTLSHSHEIAETVHKAIESEFPKVKHISVNVVPTGYEPKE